jgi:hypothetical protein
VLTTVTVAPGDYYSVALTAPQGKPLAPGAYSAVTFRPIQAVNNGLEIKHKGTECRQSQARFNVSEAVWGADDNYDYRLLRFRATFEQLCGNSWLRGEVTIGAPNPVVVDTGIENPQFPPSYFKLASPPGATLGAAEPQSFAVNQRDDFA